MQSTGIDRGSNDKTTAIARKYRAERGPGLMGRWHRRPGRTLRPRGRRLTMAGLAIVVFFGAGLGAVQAWPRVPSWTVIAAAALAAVVLGLAPLWQRWRDQSALEAATIRRNLQGTQGPSGDRLPTVTSTDLAMLGVHHAVVELPYLPRRAKEAEMADHLRAGRPVVLIGSSMVGKTRLAAEVVRRLLPDRPIVIPSSTRPAALRELDEADMIRHGDVIWLDNVDWFLTELTVGMIQRLAGSNVVVATLRAKEWDRLLPTDQFRLPQWDVLACFEKVTLDRERDQPADDDLEQAITDPKLREQIIRIGIGEYVGATHLIKEQLSLKTGANPIGYALVLAAVDWRRTGIARPLPADLLPRLATARLAPRQRAQIRDADNYAEALRWATREINPTVSLLEPVDGAYHAFDYVLDHLATPDHAIPAETWDLAIDAAASHELLEVGFQAMATYTVPDMAERAWRRAAAAGNTLAMSNVGVLLQQRGDIADAITWLRRAAEAGETGAMGNLGALLHHYGDVTEAETWYRRAAEAGKTLAMRNLVILLKELGHLAEVETWYLRAIEAGDSSAIVHLADFLEQGGRPSEAEAWWRRAVETGDPKAMHNLGNNLRRRGQLPEAETWYRKASEAGHPAGMTNLGLLLQMRGDLAEAETWLRKASEANNPRAMTALGTLLLGRGEPDEAETWYRRAGEAGDANAVSNLLMLVKLKSEVGYDELRKAEGVRWGHQPGAAERGQVDEGASD